MGRRHHTNPKPATPAPRRRKRLEDQLAQAKATDGQEISPWGPGWAPTVYSGLVQAYRTLLTEWPYHLAHIEKRLEHYDRVLDAMKANGRQDTDAFRELDARSSEHADMYVTVYRSLLTTEAVSEAVAGVGPVWVPDTVMTEPGKPGIDMRDTRILASLGPSGLLLFERAPARMHEDLGPGTPVMPEVTVDGLLWHPKAIGAWAAHADDMAPMVVLRPLTRSTAGHGMEIVDPHRGDSDRCSAPAASFGRRKPVTGRRTRHHTRTCHARRRGANRRRRVWVGPDHGARRLSCKRSSADA
ncbi:hypothetical protein [Gordonia sp. i37]|uniref:hypothetical protein n=1 Tax=Gordonia sp. i37 TaxID=1961707 RepID=UPI00209AB78C|nr:hypothetical protein [Gordonia sp. i37]